MTAATRRQTPHCAGLSCRAWDRESEGSPVALAFSRALDARQTHRVALIVVRAAGGHVVFHITGTTEVAL
jgi:hypothetical protein